MSGFCVNCVTGTKENLDLSFEGEYLSSEEGIKYYKIGKSLNKVCIILSDIFGYNSSNVIEYTNQLYKNTGYTCIIPDLFGDDPFPMNMNTLPEGSFYEKLSGWMNMMVNGTYCIPWLYRNRDPSEKSGLITGFLNELKQEGFKEFFVIGFCWGGSLALSLSRYHLVSKYVIAHPSFINKKDLSFISIEGLWICGGNDKFASESYCTELVEQLHQKNIPTYINVYGGMEHGFVIRGNKNDDFINNGMTTARKDIERFLLQ